MDQHVEDSARPNMTLRNRIVGAALVLIGVFVAYKGYVYGLGQISRLGPGALPFGLGLLIAPFGVLIAAVDPDGDEIAPVIKWRPIALVLSALLAFALLVDTAGLVIATAALVFVSGAADPEHNWKSLLAIFGFLIIFVYVVFVRLLAIPFTMIGG